MFKIRTEMLECVDWLETHESPQNLADGFVGDSYVA
jgi:hypothetical protein